MSNTTVNSTKLSEKEITAKAEEAIAYEDKLGITGTLPCNYRWAAGVYESNIKPHPMTIGPRHIKHAGDNHSGGLGEATLNAVPCAHPKCGHFGKDHEYDTLLVVQLKATIKAKAVEKALLAINIAFGINEDTRLNDPNIPFDGYTFSRLDDNPDIEIDHTV